MYSSNEKIDTNSIDLIITDPPYNLGNFMRNHDTNLSKMRDNFLDQQAGMIWTFRNGKIYGLFFEESARVIKRRFNDCLYGYYKGRDNYKISSEAWILL